MPVQYTKTGGQGHVYQVPDYPEAADGPKAFKDFADFLDLVLPPVGTIMPYVAATAPSGWLLCDGGEYSSSIYPKLATLCGTKFGSASAGNFRVPNLKGRSIAGYDPAQSEFDTIGKTGGAKTVTLTTSNLPSHSHDVPTHGHSVESSLEIDESPVSDHNHSFSGVSVSGTTGNASVSHSHDTKISSASNFNRGSNFSGSGAVVVTVNSGNDTAAGGQAHTHSFSASVSGNTELAILDEHGHSGTIEVTIAEGAAMVTSATGSGSSFSVVHPYLTLTHIIRAA